MKLRIASFKLLIPSFLFLAFLAPSAKAQYCLPTYSNTCASDDYINMVNFAGINNVGTGCGIPGPSNYISYVGIFTANVVINQTYTITCAPGPTWGQYFIALIDLNQDNDFTDAGEFFDIGYSFGGGTVSNTITIPCTALTGTTRLRVMCRYANTPIVLADICATGLSFGEIEDYNIVIAPATGTNAQLTSFVSPVTSCGMTAAEVVRVKIKNVGGTTINGYNVCYRLNNGAPSCQASATVILPCDSVTHTFATTVNLSVPGTYDFDAWVTVAGDAIPSNDTINNYMVTNIPVISTLPYIENFDVSNGGFTTIGNASSWAWGIPSGTFIDQSASPAKAWVTNLTGNYNIDELSYLVSPCFNLSSVTNDPYLSFSHIYDIAPFGDFGYVEVTTNAGATWTRLGTSATGNNWYNNTFDDAWDENSGPAGEWQSADHRLTGTAGFSSVRFRVAMEADSFTEMEGMGIDDVKIMDTLKNTGITSIIAPLSGCSLGATEPLTVEITNYGSHSVSNIPVCIRIDGGAPVCETVSATIASGASVNYTFTATGNFSAVGTHTIVSYTNWSADYTHLNDTLSGTVVNNLVISSYPYRESFENNSGGWNSGGTFFNDWAWGTPAKTTINTAGAGTKCWVTAGLGPQTYQDNTNNWVESPCFDMTSLSAPWVISMIRWKSETSWDGAVLEYSTNGTTWTEIGAYLDPFNWYNDNTVDGLINFGGSGAGWSGQGPGWVQARHEIPALAGLTNVRFRIHFATDASVVDEGFAFDDFIVADPPNVDLGPDTTVCASFQLNPGLSGGTFLWTGGASTPTLTVSTGGTYILSFTDSLGLQASDTVVINFSTTPAIELGANPTFCTGDTACVSINGGLYPSVLWSTGDTVAQVCVSTAGTLSIQVADAGGCISSDSVVVTEVAPPAPFVGNDTLFCPTDVVCIGSNCGSNHTYLWSTGATTQQICVSAAGTYWMVCTDANGCAGSDTIVLGNLPETVAIASADTSNCPIVLFSHTSTGNVTGVSWDFGDGNTSTNPNPTNDYTTSGNGSYLITFISTNDCGSDTTTFTVDINCLLSIGDASENQLKLFPNPVTSVSGKASFKLETRLNGTAPVVITIVDIHGKVVYEKDFGAVAGAFSEEMHLDATQGVYFLKFDVGGNVQVKKLVVE